MNQDDKELNELLDQAESKPKYKTIAPPEAEKEVKIKADQSESEENAGLVQWMTPNGVDFIPSGETVDILVPGVYVINSSSRYPVIFSKINVNTSDLIHFPDSKSEEVIREIERFWKLKDKFKKRNGKASILYKRGFLLYGPAGGGKSSLIQITVKDVVELGGICIVFKGPGLFTEGMRTLRHIHPEMKVVVLMEDIDSIIEHYSESEVLNILDGVDSFEDIVFLATTNYPEKLGHRIVNRPSRFDKRIKIGFPNSECRKIYLEHLLTQEEIIGNAINLDQWVEDSEGFSMAHLKELFVSCVIFGNSYKEAIETLKSMKTSISSDKDYKEKLGY